ncbi:acyl-CoA N-acyltransferase [Fusarium avenaceum]|nr:acyl-CoA N-acyltransferase [Fusarium avenaceum]
MDSPKPTLKVIRISSLDQAEQLVDLACETFIDDYWFSLIVPGRLEHPDTFRKMWSSNFREAYGDKGSVILAAYREDEDSEDGRGEFLAFAVWTRFGTSDVARSWQGDSWNKKVTRLGVMWDSFSKYLLRQTDPGVSIEATNEVFSWMGSVKHLYPTEYWSLAWLGVSPKCQRTGIGKKLLQWGIDRSEEEQVSAALVSTEVGKPLYEKMGFREVSDIPRDKSGNHIPLMIRSIEKPKVTVEET